MIYSDFKDIKLSRLGFGAMRLPLLPGGAEENIDCEAVQKMTDYAIAHGVNYFDTAYPYHKGMSEIVIGKALAKYPRDSWYLASKYPGHQTAASYDPAEIFEKQLVKCGVDHFDFYLLHNVCEKSLPVYLDKRWGIIDYFVKQKELGRIRYLGMSAHAAADTLRDFLDSGAFKPDFCQIQLNFLDWTLQDAKQKYEILTERGIPVWVMEPVRGGKLASFREEDEQQLKAMRPDESVAAWGFRWLQGLENVAVVLSGMSSPEQMEDNVRTFDSPKPLSEAENAHLMELAEKLKNSVPCTGCRYCTEGCPMKLNIPDLIAVYNDISYEPSAILSQRVAAIKQEARPSACIGCGKCARICPQAIPIPELMKKMDTAFNSLPDWDEICRRRAAAAEMANKQK